MARDATITYRPAATAQERQARVAGDFHTSEILEVTVHEDGFRTRAIPADPPIHKVFPDDDGSDDESDDESDGERFVALDGETVCAYVDVEYEPWNRRLTIADIEVDRQYRGRGVGRALMDLAVRRAQEAGATHVWLEVTNVNVPAIRAYRRMGFAVCGLDTTLYRGTGSDGEVAMFMSRTLD